MSKFAIIVAVVAVPDEARDETLGASAFIKNTEPNTYSTPLSPPIETDAWIVDGIVEAGKAFNRAGSALGEDPA